MPASLFSEIFVESNWPNVDSVDRLPRFVSQDDGGPVRSLVHNLRLAYVGVGSVGLNACLHAARLQPRAMYIVDPGKWKAESILTHPIVTGQVGAPKATQAGQFCKWISPETKVFVLDASVHELAPVELADVDCLVLSTDNLLAEVEVGQLCSQLGIPLIQPSVDGPTLVAQVRLLTNQDGRGPCLRCGFSRAELRYLDSAETFSCQGYYDGQTTRSGGAVTRSTSFLCSIAADLCNVQLLRHVGLLGKPVGDTLLEYCGYTHKTVISKLHRRHDCPCDHRQWRRAAVTAKLARCTPRQLIQAALGNQDLTDVSLLVDNLHFAERAACVKCGSHPLRRFIKAWRNSTSCKQCGQPRHAEPYYAYRPVPACVLAELLDRPLGESSDKPVQSVVVYGSSETVLLRYSKDKGMP